MAKTTSKKTTKAKATRQPGRDAKKAAKPARPSAAAPARSTPGKPKTVSKSTTKARPGSAVSARTSRDKARSALPPAPRTSTPVSHATAKPGKNQAGLNKRDLDFFRDLLIAKRRELLGDVHSMEQEALRAGGGSNLSNLPIHMADMGTDNYEQEFTLGLVEKDRQLLREINVALGKIQDGTYGLCEGTRKPITRARLEVQPWARYSIEYARQMEKGYIRGAI